MLEGDLSVAVSKLLASDFQLQTQHYKGSYIAQMRLSPLRVCSRRGHTHFRSVATSIECINITVKFMQAASFQTTPRITAVRKLRHISGLG